MMAPELFVTDNTKEKMVLLGQDKSFEVFKFLCIINM
jgi:hypothetical protein